MNGVHDMGGMDGFGAMQIEADEPVFHSEWEGRLYAIAISAAPGTRNIDEFRHAIERIPAPVYLASSYYERWLNALMTVLIEKKVLTRDELMAAGAAPVAPAQPAGKFRGQSPAVRRRRPRFHPGDRVVARNLNPAGHTRLPRYVRGRHGVIHHDRGSFVFADSNAHLAGDRTQHVYSVSFTARELWGNDAPPRDTLRIDLWEDYLAADVPKTVTRKAQSTRKKLGPVARTKAGKKS